MTLLTDCRRVEYLDRWRRATLRGDRSIAAKHQAAVISSHETVYRTVADPFGIPWPFVGCIHMLEGSSNFRTHLHNGDPLTARTTHVPKGRPTIGAPPFRWEDSAVDALRIEGLDKWEDWSLAGLLFRFEAYNGFGYRNHDIPSPYLWAGSSIYDRGYYTRDGHYDPAVPSQQIGCAVLLKELIAAGAFDLTDLDDGQVPA